MKENHPSNQNWRPINEVVPDTYETEPDAQELRGGLATKEEIRALRRGEAPRKLRKDAIP